MTSFARKLLAILVVTSAAFVTGCGSPEVDLCEAKVSCEGAGNADLETEVCLVQADANAEIADLRGCNDLYTQAIDCFAENNLCSGSKFEGGDQCTDLFSRLDDCVGDPKTLDLKD